MWRIGGGRTRRGAAFCNFTTSAAYRTANVELLERDVDHVIQALRGATLRWREVKVNRDLGIRK